jgi:hypothetical protein
MTSIGGGFNNMRTSNILQYNNLKNKNAAALLITENDVNG